MKHFFWNAAFGHVVRNENGVQVDDVEDLSRLTLSRTTLQPGAATRGHKHEGKEEVYIFLRGNGRMQVGEEIFDVHSGMAVTIPDGAFHRVWAASMDEVGVMPLMFVCVFERYERG